MKIKKLTVLAVLVILLGGTAVFKSILTQKKDAALKREATASQVSVLPVEIIPAQVARVEIGSGGKTDSAIVLEKNAGGEWTLPSHFGTRGAVWSIDDLLKTVSGLKGESRSDRPEVLGDFEIDDARAVFVKFFDADKKQTLHLLVSPLRPFGTQNFVRVNGSNRVFATSTDVLGALGIYEKGGVPDYKTFAHQQILKFDISKVSRIVLTQPGGAPLALVKKEKEDKTVYWEFDPADKSEIDPAKVSQWLGQAVNFYGTGALDPASDRGYASKPSVAITHEAGGASVTTELWVGKMAEDANLVALKITPETLAWQASAAALDGLKKEKSFFLKTADKS